MKKTRENLARMVIAAAMALPLAVFAAEDAPQMPGDGPGAPGGFADRGPGPGPRGPGVPGFDGPRGGGYGVFLGIELTEVQEDKVFAILHGQAPYLREQQKAEDKAMRALHELRNADKYDDASASKLAQAAAQAHASILLQEIRTHHKLLAVLTPEQRKQLVERKPRMGGPK